MIRGLNGQQLEEASMMEQAYRHTVLTNALGVVQELKDEGKLTFDAFLEIRMAIQKARHAEEEPEVGPWKSQDELRDSAKEYEAWHLTQAIEDL